MNRPLRLLIAITAVAALVACSDKPSSPPQNNVSPKASSTPSPAEGTPPALSTVPSMGTAAIPSETARDSAATNPRKEMSKAQESQAMPMSGQAGSHSSPALDVDQASKK